MIYLPSLETLYYRTLSNSIIVDELYNVNGTTYLGTSSSSIVLYTPGLSGISGTSGTSGTGISGFSGFSGINGTIGVNGTSGYSGWSGFSGVSGYSGLGFSGFSGLSGVNGTSGFSGLSGFSGVSGFSGGAGSNGTSGFSGVSGFSGAGASGISGYSGVATQSWKTGIVTKDVGDASTTQTIAHGLGRTPVIVQVEARLMYSTSMSQICSGAFDGTNHAGMNLILTEGGGSATLDDAYSSTSFEFGFTNAGSTSPYTGANRQTGVISVNSTNITITWTKTGTMASATAIILWKVS